MNWKRWFAWYPVRINGTWAWLCPVEWRDVPDPRKFHTLKAEYRWPPQPPAYVIGSDWRSVAHWLREHRYDELPWSAIMTKPERIEAIETPATIYLVPDAHSDPAILRAVDRLLGKRPSIQVIHLGNPHLLHFGSVGI